MSNPVRRALSVAGLAALWAAMKAFSIWAYVVRPDEYSDTYYYFTQVERVQDVGGGIATVFPEYPTPAAWLLMLPTWLGPEGHQGYRLGFLVLVTLFDAAFVAVLIARTSAVGVVGWILLTTISGRLALLRFDLVPAVLAGAAVLLLLQRRWVAAGPVIAAATAVKVWPILLFPLTLGRRGQRWAATLAIAVTGLVLAALSVANAGIARLFSPLRYQGDRGLQVEAVAATVAMVRRASDPAYRVFYSQWNAYEVDGPLVPLLLTVTDLAFPVGLVAFGLVLWRWFRRGCPLGGVAWAALFVIAMVIVTSRAFSPQYMLWIAAPAVVVLGVAWRGAVRAGGGAHVDAASRPGVAEATASYVWVVVLMSFTVLIYPVNYDDWLFSNAPGPVSLVVWRNGLLVAYALWLAWTALRVTATDGHP